MTAPSRDSTPPDDGETVALLRQVTVNGKRDGARLWLWCPGCEDTHLVGVVGDDGSHPAGEWAWDGDLERPTVNPSIKVKGVQWPPDSGFHKPTHRVEPGGQTTCHSMLLAGVWNFLPDSTHNRSGENVPVVPIPEGAAPDA